MDPEALRKQYLAEIEAAEPLPEESAEAVAAYARSDRPDEAKMCEMIATMRLDGDNYETGVRTLLDILGNDSLPTQPRLRALEQISAAAFQPVEFAQFHPEFVDLLRRLALHVDGDIRLAVFDRLTLIGDPEAQKLLRESLQNLRAQLLPVARAVQLLARDDHGSGLPIFRELAVKAAGEVREQALRALATDTRSASLFEALAARKDEISEIRHIAMANLKNTSASRFAQLARKLVLDDDDDDKLRAAAVSAITHTREVAEKVTPRFASAVESIGSGTKSRALKASIGRFSKLLGR